VVTLIGIAVIALSLAFAVRQLFVAYRAKSALADALNELPHLVAEALRAILDFSQGDHLGHPEISRSWSGVVDYIDVNADGQKELLVQYPSGSHGCALRILSWQNGRFEELARLGVGTPTGFEFGDFDGDGKIEIKTHETDWSAGLPNVTSPRLVLLLRWDGSGFVEVSREKLPLTTTPEGTDG